MYIIAILRFYTILWVTVCIIVNCKQQLIIYHERYLGGNGKIQNCIVYLKEMFSLGGAEKIFYHPSLF